MIMRVVHFVLRKLGATADDETLRVTKRQAAKNASTFTTTDQKRDTEANRKRLVSEGKQIAKS
jgi:hypothetical protein